MIKSFEIRHKKVALEGSPAVSKNAIILLFLYNAVQKKEEVLHEQNHRNVFAEF